MTRRWTEGVERAVLPNGLRVLVQRDPSAPVVAVVTHVQAGFFDEPDHWAGISHVLEHMYFKGTPRRGVGMIARETKAAGGYLNAGTSYDYTAYYTVLPASGLDVALDIQADALQHPLLDADELRRELQVIVQEARRKRDTPSAVAYETLHEVMFDRHRIRRWRIGTEETLASFTRDDVWNYYCSRYVPERTIVAVVGDLDANETLRRVEHLFGRWEPRPGAVDRSPEEPLRREVRARTLRGDVAQSELVVGWRTVPPLHPDAAPLDLAAAVLGAGRGSWLYRSLRQPGIATAVGAHSFAPTELGVFSLGTESEPERMREIVDGLATATTRLALAGPAPADLERARRLLLARYARRLESMDGRAAALAAAEALDGYDLIDRDYVALQLVTADDVRRVAERHLAPDAVSGLVYHPRDRGEEFTVDLLASAFAVSALTPLAPPEVPALAPAPARPSPRREQYGVLHAALPGADLLVRRKPGAPLVTVGVYVARLPFEPPEQAGLGALAARSALRG
ncbi:MAG: M16 family metallopeptidase, partial [Gemmatimonadota bacterium]